MDGDTRWLVAVPLTDTTPDDRDDGDRDADVHARRAEVVSRLLERGMSVRVLQALLPGWDEAIRTAVPPDPAPDGA